MSTPKFDIYAGTYEDGARLDYMIAVMQRFKEVNEADYQLPSEAWCPCRPGWDWLHATYRIPARHRPKPKTKLIPFTAETVPAEHWFRHIGACVDSRVQQVALSGLKLPGYFSWKQLFDHFEHSADRKTWLPCGVEVPDEGGAE